MKIIFKIIGIMVLGVSQQMSYAQNLVPNYSFEDTVQCPDNAGQISYAYGWYSPTTGTPDYFNSCSSVVGVPTGVGGVQYPLTGNAYIGLNVFGSSIPNIRENIQIKLTDTLKPGVDYLVKFHVNLTDWSDFAITQFGAYLSASPISAGNWFVLPYTPKIASPAGLYLNDSVGWTGVSGIYNAVGGEMYITIGNFQSDAATDTTYWGDHSTSPANYYYLDDVFVIQNDTTGILDYSAMSDIRVYPNPANEQITIETIGAGNLVIYTAIGNALKQVSITNSKTNINLNNLSNGIYYLSYKDRVQKLVVQH